jgi:hypothetical protein
MNKRISISKDDQQKRSKSVHIRWKRIGIGFSVFISLVLIGNLIGFVNNQLSTRNSESVIAKDYGDSEQVWAQWNEIAILCSVDLGASNIQFNYDNSYVSLSLKYPKSDFNDWGNSKGFRELDCLSTNIFGFKLNQKVNFLTDIPQSNNLLYLDENLNISTSGKNEAGGLSCAIWDKSFEKYPVDEIIVGFLWDMPS